MKTRLELPPGDLPVPRRLYLKGEFHVASARFASNKVQDKIDELSRRGRGRPTDEKVDNVASDLQGRFELKDGVLTLSPVSFSVRGALIQMRGRYSLVHSTLDFTGTARMNARISEMVTGWKRFPLKISRSDLREGRRRRGVSDPSVGTGQEAGVQGRDQERSSKADRSGGRR